MNINKNKYQRYKLKANLKQYVVRHFCDASPFTLSYYSRWCRQKFHFWFLTRCFCRFDFKRWMNSNLAFVECIWEVSPPLLPRGIPTSLYALPSNWATHFLGWWNRVFVCRIRHVDNFGFSGRMSFVCSSDSTSTNVVVSLPFISTSLDRVVFKLSRWDFFSCEKSSILHASACLIN